jgi:iron(III) transport system substrate-binding protein
MRRTSGIGAFLGMTAHLAAVAVAAAFAATPAIAQKTYPTDEAALYQAAKAEGSVVWYVSGPLEPLQAIGREFEKKYPGIRVETLRYGGIQAYQKFMEEVAAKQHNVDLLAFADRPSTMELIREKHVARWKVPTHDRYPESARLEDYGYASSSIDIVIAYNVNRVSKDEVELLRQWKGILDPRFKGRVSVTSQKCASCYTPLQMFLSDRYKNEFGEKFLRQVAAQKPAVYSEILVGLDRVIAGEHDINYWSFEGATVPKWEQGAPIRWVFPENTPSFPSSFQIISNYAPHPNAARLYQNWWMSEEGAKVVQKVYGARTNIQGVPDERTVAKQDWYNPPATTYTVDFDLWAEEFHRVMDSWVRILRSAQ